MGIFGKVFGKESCKICSQEAGLTGRVKLADGEYICRDCEKEDMSSFAVTTDMTLDEVRGHIEQRQHEAEIYDEEFAGFAGEDKLGNKVSHPINGKFKVFDLGKYYYAENNESGTGNFVFWTLDRLNPKSFDLFNKKEIEGACFWGEFKDGDSVKKTPDLTAWNKNLDSEFNLADIKKLYLTLFTKHPYLALADIPIIDNGGNEAEVRRIIGQVTNVVHYLNADREIDRREARENMSKTTTQTAKGLFGAIKDKSWKEKGAGILANAIDAASTATAKIGNERVEELRKEYGKGKRR